MRKYLSMLLICLFFSVPVLAQEYVPNGIKQSQAEPVIPKPRVAVYVDNRLYNDLLIGLPLISKQGNLMIPSSANVVKDRFNKGIHFEKGYKISEDRKTLTTPTGQRKVTTETAIYGDATYYSYKFLTEELGAKVTKKVIEGIPCYFFWRDLSPNTEPNPDLLPVSQYMAYEPSFIFGAGGVVDKPEKKHFISQRQLGSNIHNTTTRPKDSTYEEDLAYLNQLGGGYSSGSNWNGYTDAYISHYEGYPNIRIVGANYFKAYNPAILFNERESLIESYNMMIEALKYYVQDPKDAMAIFNYVHTCYKNKVSIPDETFMTFGKTKVLFRLGFQSTDVEILLHQNNWENDPEITWNRGVTLDYTFTPGGDYLIGKYAESENILGAREFVGSNAYLSKVRDSKNTLKQDVTYLNSLRMQSGYYGDDYLGPCMCNFEIHKHLLDGKQTMSSYDSQGYMNIWTFTEKKTSDRIEVTPGNGRKLTLDPFWYRHQIALESNDIDPMNARQNMLIETIKYLSKDVEDGKRIYIYLHEAITSNQAPTLNSVMTFGKTKVKFARGPQGKGYSIDFLP